MEIKREFKKHKEQHIHSPAHALADELSVKFSDRKHFGFYLRLAGKYDHNFLRGLAGQVLENKSTKNPGALFAYLIKKHNTEQSEKESQLPLSSLPPSP